MAYTKEMRNHYWNTKEESAKKAQEHTAEMDKKYGNQILDCISNTVIYSEDFKNACHVASVPVIEVKNLDSVSAILSVCDGKTAVLNFASFNNPGGKFIDGSRAQEESLCHESFLYNVLEAFTDSYYKENSTKKNKALYTNRALYSPNVVFARENIVRTCDVITCASPNKTAAKKYCEVSDEENDKTLKERIKFVLDIASANNVDTLILGAYGCGVFGQDPETAAKYFKELIPKHCFKHIVFAIPSSKSTENFDAFEKMFK